MAIDAGTTGVRCRAVFVDGGAHGQNEAGDPRVDVVLSLCNETKY